jgi:hypothetical protein
MGIVPFYNNQILVLERIRTIWRKVGNEKEAACRNLNEHILHAMSIVEPGNYKVFSGHEFFLSSLSHIV